MNLAFTHAGMPAVTIPSGSLNGLPLGLQIIGAYGADEPLLTVAAILESFITGKRT
jgi:Asp-tRNA(Asn)/Glu-tRNA(Gln) amidotransferase A subunit family amidase